MRAFLWSEETSLKSVNFFFFQFLLSFVCFEHDAVFCTSFPTSTILMSEVLSTGTSKALGDSIDENIQK